MRVCFIVNPISGAFKDSVALGRVYELLRQRGVAVEVARTHRPGVASRLARAAVRRCDAVVAVGGDGTVCEVAAGLAGSPVPLLVWPRGTENLVAKSLGFRAETDLLSQALLAGQTRTIDLGQVNGRTFVVVAGAGFDAEVVERLARMRVGHITHLTYFWPLWRTFWEHRWPALEIQGHGPAGPVAWQGRGMLFVGNMARYSLGLPVVRDARPDDGLLDAIFMHCCNHLQLIGHSLRTVLGRHVEHPGVRYARVTWLTVRSEEAVPLQTDGDLAGRLPAEFRVQPAALRVRLPRI